MRWGIFCWGLFCLTYLPEHARAGFEIPWLRAPMQRVLRIFFTETNEGIHLSRQILGAPEARISRKSADEVFRTLSHPGNRRLIDAIESRVASIETDPIGASALAQLTAGTSWSELAPSLKQWLYTQLERRLKFLPNPDTSRILFNESTNGESVIEFLNSRYLSRELEFNIGGTPQKVRRPNSENHMSPVAGILRNPFEQTLKWEARSNPLFPEALETDRFFSLEVGRASRSSVELVGSESTPPEILSYFVRGDSVMIPRAPYNTEMSAARVPFGQSPVVEIWPARFTASRSTVIWDLQTGKAFSVKMPTNHPHRGDFDPSKLEVAPDIQFGVQRSQDIARIDARLGLDPEVSILPEVLGIRHPTTHDGIVVRDLSRLQNDNYYMPLFSLESELKRITQVVPEALTEKYWLETLVAPMARAKAKLLLRYGIQLDTPHAQNILMELNAEFRPTGRLVFRDIADSNLYHPYFRALSDQADAVRTFQWELAQSKDFGGVAPSSVLDPTSRAINHLTYSLQTATGSRINVPWDLEHERFYIAEISRLLCIETPKSLPELDRFLNSEAGLVAIRQFHGL